MSDDISRILAAIERLEQGQSRLEAGQTQMRAEMATRDDLTELRADLMERMDGLENKLTSIRDDIAVNHGTADQVRRANDNTRDELRSLGDVVMAMERQILRLKTDVDELKGKP